MELLAAAKGESDLGPAVLPVEFERDEGEPLLFHRADEALDLALVEEELAGAVGDVVVAVPLLIGGDVQPLEEDLAPIDAGERADEGGLGVPEGLHFGALEYEPRFPRLQDMVVVGGFGVPRDAALPVVGVVRGGRHDGLTAR